MNSRRSIDDQKKVSGRVSLNRGQKIDPLCRVYATRVGGGGGGGLDDPSSSKKDVIN